MQILCKPDHFPRQRLPLPGAYEIGQMREPLPQGRIAINPIQEDSHALPLRDTIHGPMHKQVR